MLETVKDYLIGLGFAVDQGSFSNVNNLLKQFDRQTINVARIAETSLGKSVGLISESLITILKGSVEMINQVTDADLKVERLARNLWTTEQNARAVTEALSSMGKDADIDEIYRMTNEEYKRFVDIKNTLSSMELSSQGQEALKFLRDIKGDISLINGMLSYIRQWVVAFIAKYSGSTLTNFRNKLRSFIGYLKNNFIPIAETIGKWLAKGLHLIEALGWAIGKTIEYISEFKEVLAPFLGIAGIVALLKSGPIGWLIFALTSLVLIIEDIYTYTQGGKSILGELLSSDFGSNIPTLKEMSESFTTIKDALKIINEYISPILKFIGSALWVTFNVIILSIANAIEEIATSIEMMSKREKWWQPTEEELSHYHSNINPDSFSFKDDDYQKLIDIAKNGLNAPYGGFSESWLNSMFNPASGKQNVNNTINNNPMITINVNGADDPDLVSRNVMEAIKANSSWGGVR